MIGLYVRMILILWIVLGKLGIDIGVIRGFLDAKKSVEWTDLFLFEIPLQVFCLL